MHITFEALDKKKGMTLGELIANFEKVKNMADQHTDHGQTPRFVVAKAWTGSIKSFEIEV